MLSNLKQAKKIVIASHNQGKVREFRDLLSFLDMEILSASEFNLEAPEETGSTFKANALIKAEYVANNTGLPVLSDDSGLEVLSINGDPGIYSARWTINNDFLPAFERIKQELAKSSTPNDKRARFVCALALSIPNDNTEYVWEAYSNGEITFPPRGQMGFGYDPIFMPDGYTKTYGEISQQEKDQTSHRINALNLLKHDLMLD